MANKTPGNLKILGPGLVRDKTDQWVIDKIPDSTDQEDHGSIPCRNSDHIGQEDGIQHTNHCIHQAESKVPAPV